jgi:asparagine synthase (glutamine-hydrolysing)
MCGIWSYINLLKKNILNYNELFNNFMNLKNRGPDMSSFQIINNIIIGFHRLAILELSFNGNQPFYINECNKNIIFICNGEIYNYLDLIEEFKLNIFNNSDCLTIPKLYLQSKNINDFFNLFKNKIIGEYAFILYEFDNNNNLINLIIGRDQIGVRPLYINNINFFSSDICLSSEIKGLNYYNNDIKEFEPGTILNIKFNNNIIIKLETFNFKTVYNIIEIVNTEQYFLDKIKNAVINSVNRRLIADKPIAFLLSGGIDSSIIASIASSLGADINTFCCGMEGGTDFKYADDVAKCINSAHSEYVFTANEALESIKNVIYTTETWDTTTIRASVGQYLISKYISETTNFKVILVGEGSDEICSSYLFNYLAPNGIELHNAAIDYVKNIHIYDGRRADRCASSWGIETRIPFLDPEFIAAYWELPSEWRLPQYKGIEKWYLRKAFECYLPNNVVWRKKEAFSDAISSIDNSWYKIIQNYVEDYNNKEPTAEAAFYKDIFIDFFGEKRINILQNYWQPKWTNKGNNYIDPSARTLDIYNK